ncbi:MAG TPA: hypothetical protein ENN09_00470, partial [Planctomycetes bacterium]|nr:hypothetical protein [Planctomycetota bacterium]
MPPPERRTARSLVEVAAGADRCCRPLKALYEITYRCNLRCRHCYIDRSSLADEAPFGEIVDALRRAGVLFVVVSGGE